MSKPIAIFGTHDQETIEQLSRCMEDDRAIAGALCADGHLGYSMPIGGVVAYDNAISPSGVGFDIACGNKCVRTNLNVFDIGADENFMPSPAQVEPIMREIQAKVAFGLGRSNAEPVDHALFDSPVWDELDTAPGQPLKQKARAQLGTVGSGNHYVDLLKDESGRIWVANHFGSRGFGHTVASWFLAVAAGKNLGDRVPETEEPAVLNLGTPAGDLYLASMQLAGEYAYAGRDYVISQVLRILGATSDFEVHNHHNFAWEEDGLWVVRKGATPLTTEPAFIGGSMGDISVIVRGKTNAGWANVCPLHKGYPGYEECTYEVTDIGALGSAPHGAGRVMSRTQAAGKFRKFKEMRKREDGSEYEFKVRRRDPSTAAIDWPAVKADLSGQGITVLGSGADEAPGVYKDLADVLAQHSNIEILYSLRPIGVVMAGADIRDPYQD